MFLTLLFVYNQSPCKGCFQPPRFRCRIMTVEFENTKLILMSVKRFKSPETPLSDVRDHRHLAI